jgi:hypothetical protein
MSSGSYEIDTFSWLRSLPLSNNTTAYSTGTMFAVGPCAFLQPYSFYQYQSSVGFTDTSTLAVGFSNYVCTSLNSTTVQLQSNIDANRRTYMSTIPLTQWISAATILDYPFTFVSSVPVTQSTATSTILSTVGNSIISTGFFGLISSNIYPTCAPYSLYSTVPVLISTFPSTLVSSFSSNFISTPTGGSFGNTPSSFVAPSRVYDYQSTYSGSNIQCPGTLVTSNVWLGEGLTNLIRTQGYDVWAECQYNIWLSNTANLDIFSYVSTVAYFNSNTFVNKGRTVTSRIGNNTYIEVCNKFMFNPGLIGQEANLPFGTSNFHLELSFLSSGTLASLSTIVPQFDILIPGENNFTFTFVPTTSTIRG